MNRLLMLYENNSVVNITVDASRAGEGMLQVVVLADGTTVQHDLRNLGKGMYDLSFTPVLPVRHRVHLTFNEEYVPGNIHIDTLYILCHQR